MMREMFLQLCRIITSNTNKRKKHNLGGKCYFTYLRAPFISNLISYFYNFYFNSIRSRLTMRHFYKKLWFDWIKVVLLLIISLVLSIFSYFFRDSWTCNLIDRVSRSKSNKQESPDCSTPAGYCTYTHSQPILKQGNFAIQ